MNRPRINKVGIVGRGMVGAVLRQRLVEEKIFGLFPSVEFHFFSSSQAGHPSPDVGRGSDVFRDANDLTALGEMDIILTTQGGGYTKNIYQRLRAARWTGYWIDAASTLRMEDDSIIILDPVNRPQIEDGLTNGIRTFAGGNCTVSLMLLALQGLFEANLVEWVAPATYQAASGAGAENMRELIKQMGTIHQAVAEKVNDPAAAILAIDQIVTETMRSGTFPVDKFGVPLAASVIPWIDTLMPNGQTREEWKGTVESLKILGLEPGAIPVDGLCLRVGSMRSHGQQFHIKLTQDVPLDEIEEMIARANEWVKVIPNEPEPSKTLLTPTATSGTLDIPIGRIRKKEMGPTHLAAYTVGDQLLWGAAEPLWRMLRIILQYHGNL